MPARIVQRLLGQLAQLRVVGRVSRVVELRAVRRRAVRGRGCRRRWIAIRAARTVSMLVDRSARDHGGDVDALETTERARASASAVRRRGAERHRRARRVGASTPSMSSPPSRTAGLARVTAIGESPVRPGRRTPGRPARWWSSGDVAERREESCRPSPFTSHLPHLVAQRRSSVRGARAGASRRRGDDRLPGAPASSCGLTSTASVELLGRTGELGQHQHAVAVDVCGDSTPWRRGSSRRGTASPTSRRRLDRARSAPRTAIVW